MADFGGFDRPSAPVTRHRHPRRWILLGGGVVLVAAAAIGLVVFTRHSGRRPQPTATAYLAAWSRQDWPSMVALVDRAPVDFVQTHQATAKDLGLLKGTYQPGQVVRHGANADASFSAHLLLQGLGPWDWTGTLHLRLVGGHWQVEWNQATVYPGLTNGSHFVRDRSWPARAGIVGAGGASLTPQQTMVAIGVAGYRVKDPAQLTAAFAHVGIDPAKVTAALTQAAAHPNQFVAIVTVPDDNNYEQNLRPALHDLPGTQFQKSSGIQALTPDLAAHVIGSLGTITAEQLKTLGEPYESADIVGQSGLEAVSERQLAGTPGGHVTIVDSQGHKVATVLTVAPKPGTDVQTSIDPHVQLAAEQALAGVAQPAAVVAMRASTGEVLASVSRPTATPFDRALDGQYPPGSTFKMVTSADLLANGLNPNSPATCPPTITVGGRTFHNFEAETLPSLPLHQAFAVSCNTAFIGLAGSLTPQSLVTTAGQFGFGMVPKMGVPAVGGKVPIPQDATDKAGTAIGQGRVVASPLQMCEVAAAVDSGTFHPPRLVAGAPDDSTPATALDPTVVNGLRQMMAEVVTSGTGVPAAVPGKTVAGKTGTAEFGNATPPATHAWFVGFQGDVAFAILVEGGGVGGPVAGPLAARFVSAL